MTLTRAKALTASAARSGPPLTDLYETDPYSWGLQQAQLLRDGQLDLIDRLNIADEIADVSKREARATRSAIRLVLQHLLKWDAQPDRRSRSWTLSIRIHRRDALRQIESNPGLRPLLSALVAEAYADARDAALAETDLPESALSEACPYGWDEIMTRPIHWPDRP